MFVRPNDCSQMRALINACETFLISNFELLISNFLLLSSNFHVYTLPYGLTAEVFRSGRVFSLYFMP